MRLDDEDEIIRLKILLIDNFIRMVDEDCTLYSRLVSMTRMVKVDG